MSTPDELLDGSSLGEHNLRAWWYHPTAAPTGYGILIRSRRVEGGRAQIQLFDAAVGDWHQRTFELPIKGWADNVRSAIDENIGSLIPTSAALDRDESQRLRDKYGRWIGVL